MLQRGKITRIMVFGTFDMLHKGHESFFKQARRLAQSPFLIVSIARDVNVKKIKGKKALRNEKERKALVEGSSLVDKVVLGGLKTYLPHIVKEKPDVIALGYDQEAYVEGLQEAVKSGKLGAKVVRLKSFQPDKFKTSKLAT